MPTWLLLGSWAGGNHGSQWPEVTTCHEWFGSGITRLGANSWYCCPAVIWLRDASLIRRMDRRAQAFSYLGPDSLAPRAQLGNATPCCTPNPPKLSQSTVQ